MLQHIRIMISIAKDNFRDLLMFLVALLGFSQPAEFTPIRF
jgi:hypothetical protein